jgi:hypothetical protein
MIQKENYEERRKKERGEKRNINILIYVNNKTGIFMLLDYHMLTKEQTAYTDNSCGMAVANSRQIVDHLETSVRYKHFSINI